MNLNRGKLTSNVEDRGVLLGEYIFDTHSTVHSTYGSNKIERFIWSIQ